MLLADEFLHIQQPLAMRSRPLLLHHQFGIQCMLPLPKVNGRFHQFMPPRADTKSRQHRKRHLLPSVIHIEQHLLLQVLFPMLPLKVMTVGGRSFDLGNLDTLRLITLCDKSIDVLSRTFYISHYNTYLVDHPFSINLSIHCWFALIRLLVSYAR